MGRHSRRGRADKGDAGDKQGASGAAVPPAGAPAGTVPRFPDGTPAHGVPRFPDGTPAHGVPQVRGGHPEQRENGGGWGELRGGPRATGAGYGVPQPEQAAHRAPYAGQGAPGGGPAGGPAGFAGPRIPHQRQEPGRRGGPRQAYLDAFDADNDVFDADDDVFGADDDVFAPRGTLRSGPYAAVPVQAPGVEPPTGRPPGTAKGGGKGRAFAGIAAAAVTTVLAVVVAGQVADGREDAAVRPQAAGGGDRAARDSASRGDQRPTQSGTPAATVLTYDQKMSKTYALGAQLKGSGKFEAVAGFDKAPGKGRKYTYRVDVEQGLGLDGGLFAQAVQKTLNDDRSWAHNGGRTFERISSGKPDFVITLASPGTTATWCAKSGLDTTEDNVSCDSAATDRVMINAYRWAQGSETYGDRIHAYRQMLINHEVGHRLGFGHVTCGKDGDLAPVMQQQTKFLDHDGIHCKANPWAYPGS
ncbi:DUF3152 domain-containing protein [Streptomyces sp. NPDC058274]|uniref:DUF3152 domain-containing protein n=1 Tax=Streptomyces sp. NPDC058274 TaxID=3346416 RepID=UPI0036E09F82